MLARAGRRPDLLAIACVAVVLLGPQGSNAGDPLKSSAALPPLNARVAEFALAHRGEPVGDGICVTLAIHALRDAGAKRFPMNDPAGEYVWGEPVPDLKAVLPGDILQFRDAVFAGSRSIGGNKRVTWRDTYPHHTAIVVRVAENGRLVTICHQNVLAAGDDPATIGNVREAVLRMNSMQQGGQIRAYRPVAAQVQRQDPDDS